ncbi:hypothetical protein [Bradyrhizobium sp. NAS96.2]|uniref:hypothetical protein n=1 Tax=Bradyrhizobium sp. NAS96.2 TaxID=1680160 RepID=UPI001FD917C0|nr:hypothetical protein [Bradyrhizobium sp. NAS96.2]
MSKKMIKPGPDLLTQVNQAFLDYAYSGLSMVGLAKALRLHAARAVLLLQQQGRGVSRRHRLAPRRGRRPLRDFGILEEYP